jgi:hypothetical protein
MHLSLDHLVIAAADLDSGVAWAERLLCSAPASRGRHAAMGTHNALWSLGPVYLEVIAVDPAGTAPARPRWFGLDDPAMQARLADGPFLATWAVATDDLDGTCAAAPIPLGPRLPLARDDLTWEVAMPATAPQPMGGLWPLLIRWTTGLHPARRLPDCGLRLRTLTLAGPGAAEISAALPGLKGRVRFASAPEAAVSAEIETPAGVVRLGPAGD